VEWNFLFLKYINIVKMFKKIIIILFLMLSVLSGMIFSYENPETIKSIKTYFKGIEEVKTNFMKIRMVIFIFQ